MNGQRISALAILILILSSSILHGGTIHAVIGTVQYEDGTCPVSVQWSAWITGRPGECITQSSPGSAYYEETGSYVIQCAALSIWSAGETIHIGFSDGSGLSGSVETVLTNNPSDNAGTTVLNTPLFQITIASDPAGLQFTVDDQVYSDSHIFNWEQGSSHSLDAASPQNDGSDRRYVFTAWSDGGAQNHTIDIADTDQNLTVHFKSQYLLTVVSDHGNPAGSGWYDSGSSASFSVTSPEIQGSTKYVFENWSGDYSGNIRPGSIVMNGPKTVYANWRTQYQLTVQSPFGTTQGSGWYNDGTSVIFSVSPTKIQMGTGSRTAFTGWTGTGSGSYTGSDSAHTVLINEPVVEQAVWRTRHFLSINKNPENGGDVSPPPPGDWYDEGTAVSLNATPADGYQWSGWTGDTTGFANPVEIIMNHPENVTANFVFGNPKTKIMTSPSGLSIEVDSVKYTAPQEFSWVLGSIHTLDVTSPQYHLGLRYVYSSWTDGGDQAHSITTGSPFEYTAKFTGQYYLSVTVDPEEGGDVIPESPGEWFAVGEQVQVQALANDELNYVFDGWSGDLTGTENPATLVMNKHTYIAAHFKKNETDILQNSGESPGITDFVLMQNMPNPFNTETEIRFEIPAESHVNLTVVNIQGKQVAELVDGYREAGRYQTTWDASDCSSGMYIICLQTDRMVRMKKCLLIK